MIHFAEYTKAASVISEQNVTKIILLLSIDTLQDCQIFKTFAAKYPDLDAKFAEAIVGKNFKTGDFVRVQLQSGHTFFCLMSRIIEKFQPYIHDITSGIDKILTVIKREVGDNIANPISVLIPLPSDDELKLSDTIIIPALADKLNVKEFNVFVLTGNDYEQFIESITPEMILYKRDSWKSSWMLSLDDVLFINIIAAVSLLMHDYKISKTNLVRCYYVCHQHEMYPKFEFYTTEFGQFFKQFLMKSNSLINHGLLMNTHHYSNQEPKKFSCVLGSTFPHLKYLAYSQIESNRERINKIALAVRQDYFEQLKLRKDDPNKTPYQPNGGGYQKPYQKPDTGQNMFNL